jgi:hypothetical protein
LEASCAQESHGPTTWEVGTGAETSISTPHFAFRQLMAGWYQNGDSVYVFSPSDDKYDIGNFWWCDTFTFSSMFGRTLFWASFIGDTVFYQGFNDVLLTSKWKTFMTGWWWCYDYITNIMIIMYLLMDAIWHSIWLCSLILSDDFDLINRHKKTTRRCWVYWPSVAPSQAAKWTRGVNYLNADIKRSKRFPKSWG